MTHIFMGNWRIQDAGFCCKAMKPYRQPNGKSFMEELLIHVEKRRIQEL